MCTKGMAISPLWGERIVPFVRAGVDLCYCGVVPFVVSDWAPCFAFFVLFAFTPFLLLSVLLASDGLSCLSWRFWPVVTLPFSVWAGVARSGPWVSDGAVVLAKAGPTARVCPPHGRFGVRRSPTSAAQLRIAAEHVVVVEREPAPGREVALDARPREHGIVQPAEPGARAQRIARRRGKRVAQPRDRLRHGKIRVRELRAHHPRALPRVALDHALEVAEEFRDAVRAEILRLALGFALLVLVVEARAHRVMRVVRFGDQVGDGELQLVHPQPARGIARREPVAFAEEKEDVRGLPDELPPRFQERRREGRPRDVVAFEIFLDGALAAALPLRLAGDVPVSDARLLEREPHELAAPPEAGPVVEDVSHGIAFGGRGPRFFGPGGATCPMTASPTVSSARKSASPGTRAPPRAKPTSTPSTPTAASTTRRSARARRPASPRTRRSMAR